MSIIKEFKEFAIKGSVVDLAVAVIIGTAFGKIVASLVQDILMPLLGKIMGGINLSKLNIVLAEAKLENGREISPPVLLQVGNFLNTVVDFFFIAVAVFLVIRLLMRAQPPAKPIV